MSRATYNTTPCPSCKEKVTVAGAARTAHMRKHVAEGTMVRLRNEVAERTEFVTVQAASKSLERHPDWYTVVEGALPGEDAASKGNYDQATSGLPPTHVHCFQCDALVNEALNYCPSCEDDGRDSGMVEPLHVSTEPLGYDDDEDFEVLGVAEPRWEYPLAF